jgi:putative tricarboxylic transport membrane protein
MLSRDRIRRIAPYALLGAGAGYLFHIATQIEYQQRVGTLGPDFWPKALLLQLIALCAYQAIRIALARQPEADVAGVLEELVEESEQKHGVTAPVAPEIDRPLALLAGIALTALYVWVITTLGFFSATVAYLAAFIALGGYRRWGVIAAVSIVGTLLLFFFFVKIVYVSLPIGEGLFAQVTLALMQLMGIR